jgi:hypothetical protein
MQLRQRRGQFIGPDQEVDPTTDNRSSNLQRGERFQTPDELTFFAFDARVTERGRLEQLLRRCV